MPTKLQEMIGVFIRERCRRDDWIIGLIRDGQHGRAPLAIKGIAEVGELIPGLEYRFYGHPEQHPQYGESFAFKTFVRSQPHERGGVIRYLQQAPGIGKATAEALWDAFAGQAVRVLRETPDVAVAALGGRFTEKKAEEAAVVLRTMAALEDCTIDLIDVLGGRGFPKNTAKEAVKVWGNRAAEHIRRNPYLLMNFRGCGFLRCDAMYLDTGGNPGKLKRQALCLWHCMVSDTEGHTWHPQEHIEAGLRDKIGGAEIRGPEACLLARRAGLIATRRDADGKLWFAERKKAAAEMYVAEHLAAAMQEHPAAWPDIDKLDESLTDHQREQVAWAMGGVIGSLGGSPGTGKTYAAAAIAEVVLATMGFRQVAACAPTGKAAVRFTAAMAAHGIDLQAVTIHRLLEVESLEGGNWTFRHNECNPLPYRLIIVDESSMKDTGLMAHLLAARAKGTHILFVGDIHQLPPVGHGAPLRDMLTAGVPYGELSQIHRNAGTIVRACAEIREGREFTVDETLDPDADPPRNLKHIPAANGKQTRQRIVEAILRIRDRGLCDPIWDVQVVVAVNKKSDLSRRELNRLLQAELNPSEKVGSSPFRLGDKVIQLKNGFLLAAGQGAGNEDGKFFVANGDMGRVVEVLEKLTVVQFGNPDRLVKIPRGHAGANADNNDDDASTGCDLDLAYAVTCHKLQGSEAPVVIVALDEYPGARRVCSREWLYTAISRAKRVCLLVGKLGTAYGMIKRQALHRRKTFLAERITQYIRAAEAIERLHKGVPH